VETNRDEGVSRKDEIELERNADGSLTLTGPLTRGPDVIGLVQVVMPQTTPAELPSLPRSLAYALGAIGLVALAALLLSRRKQPSDRIIVSVVGVIGIVASLVAHGTYAGRAITEGRDTATAVVSEQTRQQQAIIARITAAEGLEEAPLTPGAWDTDVTHHGLGELSPDGAVISRASPPPLLGRALVLLSLLGVALLLLTGLGAFHWLWRTFVENRTAYAYISPAMIGMALLVFFPFGYGITLSFTDSTLYNANKSIAETWVGLQNYSDIIFNFDVIAKTADGGWAINYSNFYWTLLFTIIWTISNVTIGVTVGLALALVLNIKNLAFRPVYRVLLILPWAVPNYITALIWKGMFHRQFGVINHIIALFGGEPRSWFDQPLSSFATALATNGWLSFPFMMVVSLGALQSIPDELYEAAEVDGASRWQQFWAITLPALRPALVPAIILSVVWTFNMFNIIYLVTGGEPGGATEILVTQAFKHAFERYRYGYAAAYSTVIFLILLVYGVFQNRVSRATEA
jgi:arabinogalactan oligomer/maltooligosaccharide transport system permease protein